MRVIRIVVCLAGMAALLVLVPVVARSPEATYGGADPRLLGLEVAAAVALLVVAAAAESRVAVMLIAIAGAGWLVPEIAGAAGVSLRARTVSDALVPIIAAILLVAVVLRTGKLGARVRVTALVAVAGAAVASVARLLLIDPFDHVGCWRICDHNPLRVTEAGVGEPVELVGLLGLAFGMLSSAALLLHGRFRGRRAAAGRRADLAGWFLVMASVVSLLVRPTVSSARDDLGTATFVIVQVAAVAWLAGLCVESWLWWRLESRLAHLVDLLGGRSDPEVLADSLRAAVRDPGLRLAYWAPGRQAYVDGAGRSATGTDPGPDEMVTVVAREGQSVAAIVHSRRVHGPRLERALGPALRLALENAQLRAAALAELSELTGSRTRVVERAALERQRLERNLHDGAQQRAVSLVLLVRIFAEHASPADHEAGRRAEALTRTLVEELRRVARGIYPAVLADTGLVGALVDLAERSEDLPVIVGEFPEERFAGTVETTAFLVVRAGIADARVRGAATAVVSARQVDGALRVTVEDDAAQADGSSGLFAAISEFSDQVSALGGSLVTDGAPGRRRVEVVLPCE